MLLPQFFCLTACALAPDHANLTTHPTAQKITRPRKKKTPDPQLDQVFY